ncbi:MAG: cysteine desulfurase [Methylomonas sp.]|nr:cysteine desulfurase [Methylomonas sp.]PPD19300.1 MAG: cysteine desulfurase CsdA [Methylomonas sp.]PPD23854.1 MAG: cysteine desulfurase CsdA [Methylomonas sp.]PPD31798.1 MAG: cysteine desulfurase CsdA [Methylomonas sp.]PPD37638.1 MAG: cysteine desulfurase CsdA [Methylomonas sp.]
MLPIDQIRADFPILGEKIRNQPLVYLDNAASCQKPQAVIDAIVHTYSHEYANIHRGVHTLSVRATEKFEAAREKARTFINAKSDKEIIFVRGATEAINLVAQSYGRSHLQTGDEIVISAMEHHANIVPWQMLCQQIGAVLKVAPMNQKGELLFDDFENLLNGNTKLVAITHMSNALGSINPVEDIIAAAHGKNIPVLLDGAQATPHTPVDVQRLDCDFYVFSGHKLYGPSGTGVLYGKQALLEAMPPYQGGGDMIRTVSFEKTTYAGLPHKFEAGTPAIAEIIGLGAAIDYVSGIGIENIAAHEADLLAYATEQALQIKGLNIIGQAEHKGGILSFTLDHIHPHDIGTMLDSLGIAIRAGHHCAMPVMDFYGVPATARASFALYNTRQEIDVLMQGIASLIEMFG